MSEENPATTLFRDYVRIPSVQPNPDYQQVIEFLVEQAKSLGLPYKTHECCPGKPILVITWEGTDPSLASVIIPRIFPRRRREARGCQGSGQSSTLWTP